MPGQFDSVDPLDGLSWHAPPPPDTTSIDLRFGTVASLETPAVARWQSALAPPPVAIRSAWLLTEDVPAPQVVSVPIVAPAVGVRSFIFPEPSETDVSGEDRPQRPAPARVSLAAEPPAGSTRIKPPGDVIKLEDRLHYLLQPSLQSLRRCLPESWRRANRGGR